MAEQQPLSEDAIRQIVVEVTKAQNSYYFVMSIVVMCISICCCVLTVKYVHNSCQRANEQMLNYILQHNGVQTMDSKIIIQKND